jgi:hypothetical protein
MISQKYQSKWLVKNANLSLVKKYMAQSQWTSSKWLGGFFLCLSKMGLFWQKNIVQKNRNSSSVCKSHGGPKQLMTSLGKSKTCEGSRLEAMESWWSSCKCWSIDVVLVSMSHMPRCSTPYMANNLETFVRFWTTPSQLRLDKGITYKITCIYCIIYNMYVIWST